MQKCVRDMEAYREVALGAAQYLSFVLFCHGSANSNAYHRHRKSHLQFLGYLADLREVAAITNGQFETSFEVYHVCSASNEQPNLLFRITDLS